MLFRSDFFIVKNRRGYLLDCNENSTEELIKNLSKYKLRSDIKIEDLSSEFVIGVVNPEKFMELQKEVKSLREGKLNIKEAYIKDIKGELFLVGARIDPASYINQKDQIEPGRFRKLLLNKRELKNILFAISAKGQTCVPVKI